MPRTPGTVRRRPPVQGLCEVWPDQAVSFEHIALGRLGETLGGVAKVAAALIEALDASKTVNDLGPR